MNAHLFRQLNILLYPHRVLSAVCLELSFKSLQKRRIQGIMHHLFVYLRREACPHRGLMDHSSAFSQRMQRDQRKIVKNQF